MRPGRIPSTKPEIMAAKKQPVPVAVSQLKSYLAASGVGLETTGAARVTALCSTGTVHTGVVALFIGPLIAGKPQRITNTDRMANGNQARAICPELYCANPISFAVDWAVAL